MLRRKGENAHVVCAVSQKDRRALDRFHTAVGVGRIYEVKDAGAPWRWQTTNEPDSRAAISTLWPYLGQAKREQAVSKMDGSTWHNGQKDQLVCGDPTHEIVFRSDGGRRCRSCQQKYMIDYHQRTRGPASDGAAVDFCTEQIEVAV